MNYIVYNIASETTGEILRKVKCSIKSSFLQAKNGNFIIEGEANDVTQKVEFDGLDIDGRPVNPRIVDKTPEEIEVDNPPIPEVPHGRRPAHVTNEQWQAVLKKLDKLETR